VIES
jgi:hypothetical protein